MNNHNLIAKLSEFKKNPLNKTLDWSINAINTNTTHKAPNWLFRIIIVCLFITIYFYFLWIENKIIPIVYYNCQNKEKDNIEIDKLADQLKSTFLF